MAAERPRVLHVGPDVRGGMTAVIVGLLDSPLSESYRLEMVATHRGPGARRRLGVFAGALAKITWWSARGQGRIVHVHTTVRGSLYRKSVCVLLAKALRRRVVLHVHSGPGDVASFRAGLRRANLALFRFALRRSDAVLAVSAASAAALEEAFDVSGIVVVPNAAPTGTCDPTPRAEDVPPLAVYLGGFANPVKGGAVLLEALERPSTAGLRLVMAGPGDLPPAGERLLGERGDLQWRGWLEPGEKGELLREAAIFVLPSTSEGLPMALLEAMACAIAVVATEVGGVPDVLNGGSDALLVAPGDPDGLAEALSRLAGDAELRARLGAAGRARAERLNADEVCGRLDALYRDLLA
ncbi:MAG: glycosyltransferase family 4 protein [Thermoleophilia bacterium]|nr:glycosyltransferase family 4 protein [Thermoleophilia bacterium]